jgi:hypothetical protein
MLRSLLVILVVALAPLKAFAQNNPPADQNNTSAAPAAQPKTEGPVWVVDAKNAAQPAGPVWVVRRAEKAKPAA